MQYLDIKTHPNNEKKIVINLLFVSHVCYSRINLCAVQLMTADGLSFIPPTHKSVYDLNILVPFLVVFITDLYRKTYGPVHELSPIRYH